MANVLVLCTGNSCRSQMVQSYLQAFLPEGNKVYSAGVNPKPMHPFTIKVMKEDGFDISDSNSNHFDELAHIDFAWILTVSASAQEAAPFWVRFGKVYHHEFYDPRKAMGSEAEILAVFRDTRNRIKAFCKDFAQNPKAEADEGISPKSKAKDRKKDSLNKMISSYLGHVHGRNAKRSRAV